MVKAVQLTTDLYDILHYTYTIRSDRLCSYNQLCLVVYHIAVDKDI
jgi:hypothetical protein